MKTMLGMGLVAVALLAGCQTKSTGVTPIPAQQTSPLADPFNTPPVINTSPIASDIGGPNIPDTTPTGRTATGRTGTGTTRTGTGTTHTATGATPHAPPAAAAAKTYTVKKGDTLSAIAKSLYGNANLYPKIVKANPGLDPNKIKVGQKLNIPA